MYFYQILDEFREFYKFSLFSKKKSNSIGSRLLIWVLAVSSLFVIFQTLFQVNNDYKLGLTEIDRRFHQINLSYQGSLSRSIWEVNNSQIISTIEGMLQLPDVVKIVVFETGMEPDAQQIVLAEMGTIPDAGIREKTMPILIESRGKPLQIGSLKVVISLESLYQNLYGTVISILIFQLIKTFLMSLFILAIFHYLVTRHLIVMAEFSSNTTVHNLDELLVLKRKTLGENDEISLMLKAINDTKKNLKKLVETSDASVKMQLEITHREQKEQSYKLFQKEIEAKNEKLAESNAELQSTILELKSTQDKLINSEKMAALGGMVQGVAHELNTPIGLSITGASHIQNDTVRIIKLLSENNMKKSNLDDYLFETGNLSKSICVSLDKAASLIRSFKLVSVEQHEELKQNFDVRDNLIDILYSINPSLKEKRIKIINNVDENINLCSFPGVFYQIYTNLINNALLHAFEDRETGEIVIAASYVDNMLSMTFKDDGNGMTPEVIKKVFDPFFTTKRANGGTGLGMNIIYNLVNEKLLGTIGVSSEIDKGTTFSFEIPSLDQ